MNKILLLALILFSIVSCGRNVPIIFEDPLDGRALDGWIVAPESFVEHKKYGTVYQLKCDSIILDTIAPWVGDESWKNYRIEFEVLIAEERGFIGLDYHMQNKKHYGCNFHFAAWPDTIHLQSMAMWGNKKGSWKLWPVSQEKMPLPKNEWIKFRIDTGKDITNIFYNDKCIYTIYDIPFSSGGIRFGASYYASAYFRNLRITQLNANDIKPELEDIWKEVSQLNIINNWQITELKSETYAKSGISNLDITKEKWTDVSTDRRGILNLSSIYPNYHNNTILARTNINSDEKRTTKCFVTYTDRFNLYCNGKEIFKGPDRNWFNPEREKYGNSRLIPDQFEIEISLNKGENEIIVRSEAMEEFGWGFWMRTE